MAMESLPEVMGIYLITNTVSGQQYVGHAHNLRARQRRHLADLRRGAHSNAHLQRAFRHDGAAALHFDVLEGVSHAAELARREAAFIAALQPAYNLRHVAASVYASYPTTAAAARVRQVTASTRRSARRSATRSPSSPSPA